MCVEKQELLPGEGGDNNNDDDQQACSICLEAAEGDVLALPCTHCFHRTCIGEWLKASQNVLRCPLCRAEFPGELLMKLEWTDFALVPVLASLWLARLTVKFLLRQTLAVSRSIRHPLDTATSLARTLHWHLKNIGRSIYAIGLYFAKNAIVQASVRATSSVLRAVYDILQPPVSTLLAAMVRTVGHIFNTLSSALEDLLVMVADAIVSTTDQLVRLPAALARAALVTVCYLVVTTLEMVSDVWKVLLSCSRVAYEAVTSLTEALSNHWSVTTLTSVLEHCIELMGTTAEFAGIILINVGSALLQEAFRLIDCSARMALHSASTIVTMARSTAKQLWCLMATIGRPTARAVRWLCQTGIAAGCSALQLMWRVATWCLKVLQVGAEATHSAVVRVCSRVSTVLEKVTAAVISGCGALAARLQSLLLPGYRALERFVGFLLTTTTRVLDSCVKFVGWAARNALLCATHSAIFAGDFLFRCGSAVVAAVHHYLVWPVIFVLLHVIIGTYKAVTWVATVSMRRLRSVSLWAYYYVALPIWNAGCRLLGSAADGCRAGWRQAKSMARLLWGSLAASWTRSSAFVVAAWYSYIVPPCVRLWRGAGALMAAVYTAAAPVVQKGCTESAAAFLAMQARFYRMTGALSHSAAVVYLRMAATAGAAWERTSASFERTCSGVLATYTMLSTKAQLQYAALCTRMNALQERLRLLMDRL